VTVNPSHTEGSKTVCITGASGFLGRATVTKFAARGFKVLALTRPTSDPLKFDLRDQVTEIRGSIDEWVSIIEKENPISVLSYDWAGVEGELRRDRLLQEINIARVCRLAKAAKSVGVKNFITFGSQAEIDPSSLPILESAIDAPQSNYGVAKIAARKEIQSILGDSETRFLWGRVFTVYGPGDTRETLITQLIRKLIIGEDFEIIQSFKKWSFLFLDDFTEAIYALHEHQSVSGVINIGNPTISTIGEAADLIGEILEKSQHISKSHATNSTVSDLTWIPDIPTLLRLSWSPKVSLNVGLENTADWWKQLPK